MVQPNGRGWRRTEESRATCHTDFSTRSNSSPPSALGATGRASLVQMTPLHDAPSAIIDRGVSALCKSSVQVHPHVLAMVVALKRSNVLFFWYRYHDVAPTGCRFLINREIDEPDSHG